MKRILFVDDEPRILQGLQRTFRSMRDHWDMHFAEHGMAALAFMDQWPVDVVVTDMRMPGMDGAELLAQVIKRHPDTVRIVLSGHAEQESVLRLVGRAHQYLAKPAEVKELRYAIERACMLRELLGSSELVSTVTRLNSLPTLPTTYAQLREELHQPAPSMQRIGEIVTRDPGLATNLLQLVNSAFFGLRQPIANPAEAAAYLGLATLQALVLSLGLFSQFDEASVAGFSCEKLARHCYLTAQLAREIARQEDRAEQFGDECFLAGLLHNVGQLVLAAGKPAEYAQVLAGVHESPNDLSNLERTQFGASHAEIGAYLLALWGLSSSVVEAVLFHHRPAASPSQSFSPLIAVHVANALAHVAAQEVRGELELDRTLLVALGLEARLPVWREKCLALSI